MLKAAVVGVGYLGRFHAQKYKQLAGSGKVQFVGVCDSDPQRAREVALEIGVPEFTDYRKLIGQVDAVTVAATTRFHFDIARTFLEAGIHVLLEKPITETMGQAEELCQLSLRKGLKLQIGHIERFNPAYMAVRPQLRQPEFLRADRLAPFKARAADVDVVLDIMIHDIDLALETVGSRVKSVSAVGSSVVTDATDFADARLIFESGSVAQLTASRSWPETTRSLVVHQGRKIFQMDLGQAKARRIFKSTGPEIQIEEIPVQTHDAMLVETQSFLDSINGNTKPVIDGRDGLYALEVAHWIRDEIQRNAR